MKLPLLLFFFPIASAHSATFIIGDGFVLDGSEMLSDARASAGNGQTEGFPNASTNVVFNAATGAATNPFGSVNGTNGFQPLSVGRDFGGNLVRSEISFNLSNLPAAPAGFEYNITNIALSIELSNNNQANGDTPINVYAQNGVTPADINRLTGAVPSTADAAFTVLASDSPSQFLPLVNFQNPNSLLDLNTDQIFSVTLDAPNVNGSGTDFVFLGSGLGPINGDEVDSALLDSDGLFDGNVSQLAGTNFVQVAPRLLIDVELIAIPEPSTTSVTLIGICSLLLRRRR